MVVDGRPWAYLGMFTPLPVDPPPTGIVRSLRKIEVPLRWVDAFSRWFLDWGSRSGAFGVWFGGGGGSGADCWTTAGALGAERHIDGFPFLYRSPGFLFRRVYRS